SGQTHNFIMRQSLRIKLHKPSDPQLFIPLTERSSANQGQNCSTISFGMCSECFCNQKPSQKTFYGKSRRLT
ncbi:MAG: hypothetical protein M0P32_02180, partial [Bacteroidales bacterium]|nr:hypothetical protein [Bacteroidales bacterium]